MNPLQVPDVGVASEILSRILNLDRAELHQRLDARAPSSDQGFLVVKTKITPEESERLRELHLDWIGLDRESQRHYPKDTLAAHVLGSVDFEEQGNGGVEMSMEAGAARPGRHRAHAHRREAPRHRIACRIRKRSDGHAADADHRRAHPVRDGAGTGEGRAAARTARPAAWW